MCHMAHGTPCREQGTVSTVRFRNVHNWGEMIAAVLCGTQPTKGDPRVRPSLSASKVHAFCWYVF